MILGRISVLFALLAANIISVAEGVHLVAQPDIAPLVAAFPRPAAGEP